MRVLVTGASGQLGKDVVAFFNKKGTKSWGAAALNWTLRVWSNASK